MRMIVVWIVLGCLLSLAWGQGAPDEAWAVIRALKVAPGEEVPALLAQVKDAPTAPAIRTLGRLRDHAATPTLLPLLTHADAAIRALGRIPDPQRRAVPVLTALLEAPGIPQRTAAREALDQK